MIYSLIVLILISPLVWPLSYDAIQYANMANHNPVQFPYSNRILIPYILGLFPIRIHEWIFLIITLIGLILSDDLLYLYYILLN